MTVRALAPEVGPLGRRDPRGTPAVGPKQKRCHRGRLDAGAVDGAAVAKPLAPETSAPERGLGDGGPA
eukprot:4881267-Pyramimonas_sp.AAC.1